MKLLKRLGIALLSALVVTAAAFVFWAETPLGPAPAALTALESDSQVRVTVGDFVTFQPATVEPTTAFIFYPGGRVDYRSYAAPLREIAAQGYLVVLLPVRLNLAFFDVNAAAPVFDQYPQIKHWAVGGHSLGGVASALYAQQHLNQMDGVIFWASYPADDSLKTSGLKFLTIYGTRDMAGVEKFKESRALLPDSAQFVVIDGGNHAQFGDYGAQPGDNAASISVQEQQAQIVEATVNFLANLQP
ncbi:MAG: alpha/beta hydrolase [Anaerolineales bacterium]